MVIGSKRKPAADTGSELMGIAALHAILGSHVGCWGLFCNSRLDEFRRNPGSHLANHAHAICLLGRSKLRIKATKTPIIRPTTPPKAMIKAFFGLTGASGSSAC